MPLCPCRQKTDYFCFVHRKPICTNCIKNHPHCHIATYKEFLSDSESRKLTCPVCEGGFEDSSPSIRLTCFHVLHPICLSHHASTFPPHTAQAGYTCPVCSVPIIPPESDKSELALIIRDILATQDWAQPFLSKSNTNPLTSTPKINSPVASPSTPTTGERDFAFTPISRKSALSGKDIVDPSHIDADDPEHKYRRRGLTQLLVALGLITPGQGGHALNSKRLIFVFLIISTILLFWVLIKSSSPTVEDVEE